MNALLQRSRNSLNWFASNPFRNTLGLAFVGGLVAVAAVRLTFAAPIAPLVAALTPIASNAATFQSTPINQGNGAPPLVMLLLSRDEQLSIKAYTDYTDLDGDGTIDTTYKDNFAYGGYFDSTLCYSYSTLTNLFAASGGITGGSYTNGVPYHQCNGSAWAGNFLNWLTMTRMDIVRYTLFGGKRAVDTTSQTVLQRAFLPDDVHSFQKVYAGSDINLYTPYAANTSTTNPGWSFCNTSNVNSKTAYTVGYQPLLRVAKGSFPEWASTEERQCDWGDSVLTSQSYADSGTQNSDQPLLGSSGSAQLQVLVDVCDNPNYRESFCRAYTSGTTVTTVTYKPAGLLQQYGESGQLRFGLITGTYDHPRTGGAVRRNIGLIAGNGTSGCATGDEINLQTGQFCNQVANAQGIINSIDRLQVSQWPDAPSNSTAGTSYTDCNNPTGPITNRTSGVGVGLMGSPSTDSTLSYTACSDWHNPLAEMFAEALRYIEGGSNQATAGFAPAANGNDYALGLPTSVTWTDPYSSANYCASCSIVVLSTGFGSFDSDEIPNSGTIPNLGESVAAATTRLGGIENGLGGKVLGSDIIGYYGLTPTQTGSSDVTYNSATGLTAGTSTCSAKSVMDFSLVRGVCPQQPNFEGSYYLAGLAFDAWTHDLRPDLTLYPGTRHVKTFAVSLAETLPTLNVPVGSGNIVISPLCENYGYQATTTTKGAGNAPLPDTTQRTPNNSLNGISTCTIDDALTLQQTTASTAPFPLAPVTFGLPTVTNADGSSTGSLLLVYDDSPWGHDHDRDIIEMITYCSGAACKNSGICQDKVFSNQAGTTLITSGGTPRNACSGLSGVGSDGSGVGTSQILVRTEMISASSGNGLVAGFNINGTMADGPYATANHPGSNSDTSSVLTGQGVPMTPSNQLGLGTAPVVVEFTASSSSSNTLQNPLFYAAKYGGFVQSANGAPSLTPSTQPQWDQFDNSTGAGIVDSVTHQPVLTPNTKYPCAPGDCLPDNYFPVRNPTQLKAQLAVVFANILGGTGSGTAAAVVSNQRGGDGATYQAYYVPTLTDSNGSTATWLGSLQSLFTDQQGNLREDTSSHSGILNETSFSANPAVSIFYDNVSTDATYGQTVFNRYANCSPAQNTSPTSPCAPTGQYLPLSQLNPIWNARDKLAATPASVTTGASAPNRAYTDTADKGRYIFTFIDKNLDGQVAGAPAATSSEVVPFALSSFYSSSGSNNTYGLLNVGDPTSAQELINYIRGQDYTGLRNRTINYSNSTSTTAQTYPLGDIVDSTPAVVGTPEEAYDLLYNDSTFATFRAQYQFRRNVVYAGGNDGMLHAFNAGFYNPNATCPSSSTGSTCTAFGVAPVSGTFATTPVAHPLGSELWAYVPFNLLPHLIWLTSSNYNHVYYVDGSPKIVDARVFTADGDHPGGWGTVLIVGFRFGGGDIDLPASNCLYSAAFSGFSTTTQSCGTVKIPTKDIYTHSAYVVMDITNPEAPPRLMAEIAGTADSMTLQNVFGFTTSFPAVVPFSARGGSTSDYWYLTFGNGPKSGPIPDLATAVSSATPSLYIYKLASGTTTNTPAATLTLPGSDLSGFTGFTGDPVSVDWNLDFLADAIFVGTAGGSPAAPTGQLVKIDTSASSAASSPSSWTVTTLANPAEPILAAPSVTIDSRGQHWVYAGTGRLFVAGDKANNVTRQSLFGVIENTTVASTSCTTATPCRTYANLADVSAATVTQASSSSAVVIAGVTGTPQPVTNEATLEAGVQADYGWKIKLNLPATTTTSAERVLSSTAISGGALFATAFTPDTSLCTGLGSSRLFGVNFITGVANSAVPTLGSTVSGGTITFPSSISLGSGLAAAPSLDPTATTGTNGQLSIVTQTSTGAIVTTQATVAPTEKNGEVDWRETLPNSN